MKSNLLSIEEHHIVISVLQENIRTFNTYAPTKSIKVCIAETDLLQGAINAYTIITGNVNIPASEMEA